MKRLAYTAGLVGLFAIVMLAASVQGTPTITPPDLARIDGERFEPPEPTMTPDGSPTPLPERGSDLTEMIIGAIFLIFALVAATLIVTLVIRALMRAWRDRPLRRRDDGGAAFELSGEDSPEDAAAPAIRRGIEGALRSIEERTTPADAIIAAWVGLEESAADAGLTRGRSETPAEFALRIITRRAGITDAATDLLRLYERVRFGGHQADEADRTAARAALKTIEEGWR